ncbi:BtpA/SgcQ family protein [Treponema parvum]|uniref:BtpA/SgcQ family protein n=1 Tax=Treponema parvum TaxID=138851 RepID=A0A975IDE6_9SPIR|nr:BtpA/SgcQ family protein [Treponema parvum]QTQ12991.1 BtpA/SgcQ family protein [Treponema parvum]
MNFDFSDGHKLLVGMVHLLPLPGTYRSKNTIKTVIERAVTDAKILESCGFGAILIENEDLCNSPKMTKLQFASMSIVVNIISNTVLIPVGVTCGCTNYEESLSIAFICGCDFIRTPIFVDTLVNYNGVIAPCSSQLITYRKQIGAEKIKVFADIQVKHYHMLDKSIDITESALWAQRQGADAIVVTGTSTGVETKIDDIERVKKQVDIPVAVGSGVSDCNIKEQAKFADIFIIGTNIRKNGKMSEPIDSSKASKIIKAL